MNIKQKCAWKYTLYTARANKNIHSLETQVRENGMVERYGGARVNKL